MAERQRVSELEMDNSMYNFLLAYGGMQKHAAAIEAAEAIGQTPSQSDIEKASRFADQVEQFVNTRIDLFREGPESQLPLSEKVDRAYQHIRSTVEADRDQPTGVAAAARNVASDVFGKTKTPRQYTPMYQGEGISPDYTDFDVAMSLPTAGGAAIIGGAGAVAAKRYAQKGLAGAISGIGLKKTGEKVGKYGTKELSVSMPKAIGDIARRADLSMVAPRGVTKAAKSIAKKKPAATATEVVETIVPVPVPPPPAPLGLTGPMPETPMIGFGTPAMTEAEIIMAQQALKNPGTTALRGEGAKRAAAGSPWGEAPPTKPLTTPVQPGQLPIAGALPEPKPIVGESEGIGYERALQSLLVQPEAIPYGARLPLRLDLIRGNTKALNAIDEGIRTQRIRLTPDGHLESLVQSAPVEVVPKSVIDATKRAFDARSLDRTDWWTRQ